MSKMKVDVYLNGKKEKKDYQDKVIDKLKELGAFIDWEKEKDRIYIVKPYAISDMFIKAGLLQIVLKDIAYFELNIPNELYLKPCIANNWQEVYNKIKNIDSIEYEVKE
jgi:hypothetical protein